MSLQIDAKDLLSRPDFTLLDVRAEGEFAVGHVPGSVNLPLLKDSERHDVGLTYKVHGQAAAIKLGHQLVDPHRPERVAAWKSWLGQQKVPVLTCARGGLRSEISQRWITEAGLPVARIRGGYKALRNELLRELEKPVRGYVITGLTGVNKTEFLRSLATRSVDLEALAVHRGSAFGGLFQPCAQPAQATFENAVALALRGGDEFLFEDESRLVGRCVIPPALFERIKELPRLELLASEAERIANIEREYVTTPLLTRAPEQVMLELIEALRTLRNRLGGLAAAELEAAIRDGFARANHRDWIGRLLFDYYDKLYAHAMSHHGREPLFRGTAAECEAWLRKNTPLTWSR